MTSLSSPWSSFDPNSDNARIMDGDSNNANAIWRECEKDGQLVHWLLEISLSTSTRTALASSRLLANHII